MAKKKKQKKQYSEKLAFGAGLLDSTWKTAQGQTMKTPTGKFRIPKGKAGAALALGAAGLGIASTVQAVRESSSVGEGAVKIFGTNVLASFGGRIAGGLSSKLALKGTKALRTKTKKYAASKAKNAGSKVVKPKKGKVAFRKIKGRIVPVQVK